ncbi:MAG: hypothetical protein J2O48_01630 [Solirubrobacterales bacterium]|nr:hypothetical protein [Solirubrobacterales bacterium]
MPLIAAGQPTDFVSLHTAVKYVAGAYIVVFAIILIYLGIMAWRLANNQRELAELHKLVEERDAEVPEREQEPAL